MRRFISMTGRTLLLASLAAFLAAPAAGCRSTGPDDRARGSEESAELAGSGWTTTQATDEPHPAPRPVDDPVGKRGEDEGGASAGVEPSHVIDDALYRARYEAARTVVREHLPEERPDAEARGLTRVVIDLVGNAHGELEDCGCRRNPLGGLTRRATILNRQRGETEAHFHVDTGAGLYETSTGSVAGQVDERVDTTHAGAYYAALAAMGVDAVGVGPRDLSRGGAVVHEAAERVDLPILAGNAVFGERRLADATRVVRRGSVTVGFVGVSDPRPPGGGPAYWDTRGLAFEDAEETAREAITALREQQVDLVVLVSPLGVEGSTELVEKLAESGQAPDLAVVSGTGRMMREPLWAAGVPIVEPYQQGKYLVRAVLQLADGPIDFTPGGYAERQVLRSYITALRAANVTRTNLRARGAAARPGLARLYREQVERLEALRTELAEIDLAAIETSGPRSHIELELIPVALSIDEEPEIRSLLDQTYAAIEERFGPQPNRH